MKISKLSFDKIPKYLRNGIKEESKPISRAVHVGRAIREKTLGQSNSGLLLHGYFDDADVEDFGHEPKRKETAKEPE